jgi:hypothetical protein
MLFYLSASSLIGVNFSKRIISFWKYAKKENTRHITAKGPTKPNSCEKKAPNKQPANYPNSSENSIQVTTLCSSFLCCAVASARAAVCMRPAPIPSMILPRNPSIRKLVAFYVNTNAIINMHEIACKILPILKVCDLPHFDIRFPAKTDEISKVIE